MRSLFRILVLAWLVAACGFDRNELDDRRCTSDSQCRPGERCTSGFCSQQECVVDADCGAGHQFACTEGLCVVQGCTSVDDCGVGFDCQDGMCIAACVDHDGDGVPFGTGCPDPVDCNDADPAQAPGQTEGPRGSPTCSDNKDNDCDGTTDVATATASPRAAMVSTTMATARSI